MKRKRTFVSVSIIDNAEDEKFSSVFDQCKDALMSSLVDGASEIYEEACGWDCTDDGNITQSFSSSKLIELRRGENLDEALSRIKSPLDIVKWCIDNECIPEELQNFDFYNCEVKEITFDVINGNREELDDDFDDDLCSDDFIDDDEDDDYEDSLYF